MVPGSPYKESAVRAGRRISGARAVRDPPGGVPNRFTVTGAPSSPASYTHRLRQASMLEEGAAGGGISTAGGKRHDHGSPRVRLHPPSGYPGGLLPRFACERRRIAPRVRAVLRRRSLCPLPSSPGCVRREDLRGYRAELHPGEQVHHRGRLGRRRLDVQGDRTTIPASCSMDRILGEPPRGGQAGRCTSTPSRTDARDRGTPAEPPT